jgi:phosphoribosylaminoimidazole-succinocarboxamide synthase
MSITKLKPAREKFFEGNEKILYYHDKEDYGLIEHFKDNIHLTDGNLTEISGVGILRNSLSAFLMQKLDMISLEHHFIEKINMREQVVQMVDMLPLKVSVTYLACGRYVTDFGIEEGMVFEKPLIDFHYKSQVGFLPVVNEEQIMHLCYLNKHALDHIKLIVSKAGDFLTGLFAGSGIRLVESTFSLGTVFDGTEFITLIADEISPATCRLWDLKDNTKLDFESMMNNPANSIAIYQEVAKRLGVEP